MENKLCDFLIEDSKTVMLIPVFISREEKKVKSFSVGKFPIKELPAIGQPPMPSIAPSNRRQPESKAAEIFSYPHHSFIYFYSVLCVFVYFYLYM